ncbi:MAG: hypothetical protein JWP89_5942 [Schlesneria sp.]|nr:hypothetical protein [Schlesneria sp.]
MPQFLVIKEFAPAFTRFSHTVGEIAAIQPNRAERNSAPPIPLVTDLQDANLNCGNLLAPDCIFTTNCGCQRDE